MVTNSLDRGQPGMASSTGVGLSGLDIKFHDLPAEKIGMFFSAAVFIIFISYFLNVVLPDLRLQWKLSRYPVINKKRGEWSNTKALQRVAQNLRAVLQEGSEKVGTYTGSRLCKEIQWAQEEELLTQAPHQYDGPFQVIGTFGTRLVLPPATADAIKNDPRFTAKEVVEKTMASSLPGFEGLRAPETLILMIRNNLSTNLGMFLPLRRW